MKKEFEERQRLYNGEMIIYFNKMEYEEEINVTYLFNKEGRIIIAKIKGQIEETAMGWWR